MVEQEEVIFIQTKSPRSNDIDETALRSLHLVTFKNCSKSKFHNYMRFNEHDSIIAPSHLYRVANGLDDVSKYPDLFAELIKRGWSNLDLQKLAGRNVIRVFQQVEQVNNLEDGCF